MKTLILRLGNGLLGDDGIGILAAGRISSPPVFMARHCLISWWVTGR